MSDVHFPRHEYYMRLAIREARRAAEHGDVPVGCVIVLDGEVIAAAGNERELRQSPMAHAEVLAIEQAAARMRSWRLLNTVLYVTIEPCPMCAGAIVHARVARVVYGARDPRTGAAGSVFDLLPSDDRFNHRTACEGGVLEAACGERLRAFFRARRSVATEAGADEGDRDGD